jgi:hypothetical protein
MSCDGFGVVHQAHLETREAANIGGRREDHDVQMCCSWRVECSHQARARRVGGMRSAPPISPSVIRTPISAAAYRAISLSSMRLLLEQGGSQGGYFFCVDQVTLNKLMAAKKRPEAFSDVIIRMAKAEAMASNRSPVAIDRA